MICLTMESPHLYRAIIQVKLAEQLNGSLSTDVQLPVSSYVLVVDRGEPHLNRCGIISFNVVSYYYSVR